MKKIILIAFLLVAALAVFGQKLTMKADQRLSPYVGGFYEWTPPGYDPNKAYDLIIFSHGQGELGAGTAASLPKVLNNGLPRLIRDNKFTDSFIVLIPQFKQCECEGNNIPLVIDYALKTYKVKGGKVFLAGLSLGGSPTWWGAINRPDKVHGIVPMCGISPMAQVSNARGKIIADAKIGVLAFHNNQDPTVSVYQTINSISSINNAKPAVPPVAVYPVSKSHDVWTYASNPATKVNGQNIYEWMHAISAKSSVPEPPKPVPPIVQLEAQQMTLVEPLNYVLIHARATKPVSFTWRTLDAPTFQYCLAGDDSAIVLYNVPRGTWRYEVTGTDTSGLSGKDTLYVEAIGWLPKTQTYHVNISSDSTLKLQTKVRSAEGNLITAQLAPQLSSPMSPTYNGGQATYARGRFRAFNSGAMKLTLSDLNPLATYDLELYAITSTNPGQVTGYSSQGQTGSLSTYNNTKSVIFTNLKPDANQQIVVDLKPSLVYSYLSTFTLTEKN